MSYSQSKKIDNRYEHEETTVDAKLRKLRRDHQPKLNPEEFSKIEYRGKESENSKQNNIDYLLSLKRDGLSKERLIKR
jgi:hypothetical protein